LILTKTSSSCFYLRDARLALGAAAFLTAFLAEDLGVLAAFLAEDLGVLAAFFADDLGVVAAGAATTGVAAFAGVVAAFFADLGVDFLIDFLAVLFFAEPPVFFADLGVARLGVMGAMVVLFWGGGGLFLFFLVWGRSDAGKAGLFVLFARGRERSVSVRWDDVRWWNAGEEGCA
jgi:hypothetical protein